MRVREAILMVALTATLSACTGDADSEDKPSDPLAEITVECDEFADASERIANAQAALYSDTGDPQAMKALERELQALEEDAPSDVRTALGDMSNGFEQARNLLQNATRENKAKLQELMPKLAKDSQTVTAYIASQCG